MSAPEVYLSGKKLQLVKRIGHGGEGDVYLLGDAKKAVKIYKPEKRIEREAKVHAMVRGRLSESTNLVAFPEDVVTDRSGTFVGFTMRLVDGFHPLHELYAPKSRKINYPKADFRFLVRTAANVARAVAQVHNSPCVIGDLNESGILVSQEATVALIDADSFQFADGTRIHPCLVGKPEFTAPELHGRSLQHVTRTKTHDGFGLAVAIFQLLFMGRHPYAGQKKGSDLTLEQMIAGNLFAYSKSRSTGVVPPGILPGLEDFPTDIADAFERAFGQEPSKRPAASEWVSSLQGLERNLSRCSSDSAHYFPATAKQCPWCKMQAASGTLLFVSPVTIAAVGGAGLGVFDVEKALVAIRSMVVPDPNSVLPQVPAFSPSPSAEASSAQSSGLKYKLLGVVVIVVAIACWINMPGGFLLWLVALLFGFAQFGKTDVKSSAWQERYGEIDSQWDDAVNQWRRSLGVIEAAKLRVELEASAAEYRGLTEEKTKALMRLSSERRSRQLQDYLDTFLISRATISGIGHAKTTVLASYGIESAADISTNAILNIPGFGPATASKLLDWRKKIESRFVYNPAPNQSDVLARAKAEADFAARAAALTRKISGGIVELGQLTSTLHVKLKFEDRKLAEIARGRSQLDTDLKYLGISKPFKPAAAAVYTLPLAVGAARPSAPYANAGHQCPKCGAAMVRRRAKRGSNRGSSFWGCTRFPYCKGTRH